MDTSKLTRDQLLMEWSKAKQSLDEAKTLEMELRNEIMSREFPNAREGVNTVELGAGYKLKGTKKFNYNLVKGKFSNVQDAVEKVSDEFASILSNEGEFILERLFKWKPEISVAEYKNLIEDAKNSPSKKKALDIVNKIVEIKDAAPELKIVEP